MKIAVIYGPNFLGGKRLKFGELTDDPAGLTGSELSFIRHSQNLAMLGHEVHTYTPGPEMWGVVHDFSSLQRDADKYDVAICWNESEPLRMFRSSTLRVVSYHRNEFDGHSPDVDDIVDIWLSPSDPHREMVPSFWMERGFVQSVAKWRVVPNGCDPNEYCTNDGNTIAHKVPGRVIWASSPDRGLHWLLQEWPKIRRAVPHATLHIMYRLMEWLRVSISPILVNWEPGRSHQIEWSRRSNLIYQLLSQYQQAPDMNGVTVFDSVSHTSVKLEMVEAEVLAYSCDPYRWTESYSVTLMEACAARACPVATAVDALPHIYGGTIPLIRAPLKDSISEFSDTVIHCLLDPAYRAEVNQRARALAEKSTWKASSEKLFRIIEEGMKSKQ